MHNDIKPPKPWTTLFVREMKPQPCIVTPGTFAWAMAMHAQGMTVASSKAKTMMTGGEGYLNFTIVNHRHRLSDITIDMGRADDWHVVPRHG